MRVKEQHNNWHVLCPMPETVKLKLTRVTLVTVNVSASGNICYSSDQMKREKEKKRKMMKEDTTDGGDGNKNNNDEQANAMSRSTRNIRTSSMQLPPP